MTHLLWVAVALGADALETHAEVHVLPNGLTVVLEESRRTDAVALHLHYGVGSRDEADGEHGCAHLFEHLMFEGSANVPQNAFDTWLTTAGGDNNAFTTPDETAYTMTFPSGASDLALFLESDRMGFLIAGLTQDNLANQQSVVLQERAEGYAEPHGKDWDALNKLQHPPGHPYHVPVIGRVADIEGYQLEAVRGFWRRHYRPRNAVLGIVGNFDAAEMLGKVEHWFSDVPDPGPPPERLGADADLPEAFGHGFIEDAVEDWRVLLSWPTVPMGHADEPALDLLSYILSNGRGTRLDDRLYFKTNLTTGVGAYHDVGEIDSEFVVFATTERPRLPRLVKVFDRVMARVARLGPTADELHRAKRSLRAGVLEQLELPESRAEVLVDCQRMHGTANCLPREWARYEAVTRADVMRVAASYLDPSDRSSLSVVPKGDGGQLPGAAPVELP